MRKDLRFVLVVAVLLAAGIAPSLRAQQATYYPASEWRTSTPEEQGMDSTVLVELLDKRGSGFHSLVVVRNGYVVLDVSTYPFDAHAPHATYSATKVFVSTLMGIAIDQGYVQGVDQSIWDFFDKEATANMDARKEAITIEDLLTQRAGLTRGGDWLEYYDFGEGDQSWVQSILDHPMDAEPGTQFSYRDANPHLVAAIIQLATGMSARDYAQQNLFDPLGIHDLIWLVDPQGVTVGGDELFLSTYDLARLGYLYLNKGEWDGRQVISSEWVEVATSNLVTPDSWSGHGYYWLNGLVTSGDRNTAGYTALGMDGQWILVMPEMDLVIALTGDSSYRGLDLEAAYCLESVKSDDPLPANPDAWAQMQMLIDAQANPAPRAVASFPEIALQIENHRYALEENKLNWESVSLEFEEEEALLTLELGGEHYTLPVGLDGIERISTVRLPGYYPFEPAMEVQVALKGSWTGAARFQMTWTDLLGADEWSIGFQFEGDNLRITAREQIFPRIVNMVGAAQS